jgi:SpoVK/Ycf46/Vps4 family AAA+-type ATPase
MNNKNLLTHIERISSEAAKSKLNLDDIADIKEDVDIISEFLGISAVQAVLFSCMAELSLQRTISVDSLARHFKCSVLRVINLITELDMLEKKALLSKCSKASNKKYSYNDLGYSVPHHIIEALRTHDKNKLKENTQFSLPGLLEKITEMIDTRESNSSSTSILLEQVEFLLQGNHNQPFIEFINKHIKHTIDKCIVLALAFLRFKKEDTYSIDSITSAIFDDLAAQLEYEHNFKSGSNDLFKRGIIQFRDSQFTDERIPVLSHKALKVLYQDYPDLAMENENGEGIISVNSIKAKSLFFDDGIKSQLDKIEFAISQKNFKIYQKRLHDNKMPIGITVIFHGHSGTGKTETVYQIARRTKRTIMMVDLSQVRSKWFGESEKQVKKIFDDYRRLYSCYHVKPILFINEADGLFSKRMQIRGDSSTEQVMNTMQSIILQELERFEGILFATTNLTMNLDSAFERRFLFKVEFPNPLPMVSERIWKSLIPDLKSAQIKHLVSNYQLSGGEIENVVRKYLIERVVYNGKPGFEKLTELCSLEKSFVRSKKIGYLK